MSKHKVMIDGRDSRTSLKLSDVELPSGADVESALAEAGWTDDPRTGKAVLLPDGREVLNPLPIAVPLGFAKVPSVIDQVMEKMAAHRRMQLEDSEEIDLAAEVDDFDVDDDYFPDSPYEVTMKDDFPGLRSEPPVAPAGDPPLEPPVPPAPPVAPAADSPRS